MGMRGKYLICAIVIVLVLGSFFKPTANVHDVQIIDSDLRKDPRDLTLEEALREYYPMTTFEDFQNFNSWDEEPFNPDSVDNDLLSLRHRRDTDAMMTVFEVLDEDKLEDIEEKERKLKEYQEIPEESKVLKRQIRDVVIREMIEMMYPDNEMHRDIVYRSIVTLSPEHQYHAAMEWGIISPSKKLTVKEEKIQKKNRHKILLKAVSNLPPDLPEPRDPVEVRKLVSLKREALNSKANLVNDGVSTDENSNKEMNAGPDVKTGKGEDNRQAEAEIKTSGQGDNTMMKPKPSNNQTKPSDSTAKKRKKRSTNPELTRSKGTPLNPQWKMLNSSVLIVDVPIIPRNNTAVKKIVKKEESYNPPRHIELLKDDKEYAEAYERFQQKMKALGKFHMSLVGDLDALHKLKDDILERRKLKGFAIKHEQLWENIFKKRENFVGTNVEFRQKYLDDIREAEKLCRKIIGKYGNLLTAKLHDVLPKKRGKQKPMNDRRFMGFELEVSDRKYFEKIEKLIRVQNEYGPENRSKFFSDYRDYIVYLQEMRKDIQAKANVAMLKRKHQKIWEKIYQERDYFNGTDKEFQLRHHQLFTDAEMLNDKILKLIGKIALKKQIKKICQEETKKLKKQGRKKVRKPNSAKNSKSKQPKKEKEDVQNDLKQHKSTMVLKDEVDLRYIPEFLRRIQETVTHHLLDRKRQKHYDQWINLFKERQASTDSQKQFLKSHSKRLDSLDSLANELADGYASLSTAIPHVEIRKRGDENNNDAEIDPIELQRLQRKFPGFIPFDVDYLLRLEKLMDIQKENYQSNKAKFFKDYRDQLNEMEDEKKLLATKSFLKVRQRTFEKQWADLFQNMDHFTGDMQKIKTKSAKELEIQSSLGRELLKYYGSVGKQERNMQEHAIHRLSRQRRSPDYITQSPPPDIYSELKDDIQKDEQRIDNEIVASRRETQHDKVTIETTNIPGTSEPYDRTAPHQSHTTGNLKKTSSQKPENAKDTHSGNMHNMSGDGKKQLDDDRNLGTWTFKKKTVDGAGKPTKQHRKSKLEISNAVHSSNDIRKDQHQANKGNGESKESPEHMSYSLLRPIQQMLKDLKDMVTLITDYKSTANGEQDKKLKRVHEKRHGHYHDEKDDHNNDDDDDEISGKDIHVENSSNSVLGEGSGNNIHDNLPGKTFVGEEVSSNTLHDEPHSRQRRSEADDGEAAVVNDGTEIKIDEGNAQELKDEKINPQNELSKKNGDSDVNQPEESEDVQSEGNPDLGISQPTATMYTPTPMEESVEMVPYDDSDDEVDSRSLSHHSAFRKGVDRKKPVFPLHEDGKDWRHGHYKNKEIVGKIKKRKKGKRTKHLNGRKKQRDKKNQIIKEKKILQSTAMKKKKDIVNEPAKNEEEAEISPDKSEDISIEINDIPKHGISDLPLDMKTFSGLEGLDPTLLEEIQSLTRELKKHNKVWKSKKVQQPPQPDERLPSESNPNYENEVENVEYTDDTSEEIRSEELDEDIDDLDDLPDVEHNERNRNEDRKMIRPSNDINRNPGSPSNSDDFDYIYDNALDEGKEERENFVDTTLDNENSSEDDLPEVSELLFSKGHQEDTSPLDKLEIADLKENIEDTERKANVDDQNKRNKDPLGHTDQETGNSKGADVNTKDLIPQGKRKTTTENPGDAEEDWSKQIKSFGTSNPLTSEELNIVSEKIHDFAANYKKDQNADRKLYVYNKHGKLESIVKYAPTGEEISREEIRDAKGNKIKRLQATSGSGNKDEINEYNTPKSTTNTGAAEIFHNQYTPIDYDFLEDGIDEDQSPPDHNYYVEMDENEKKAVKSDVEYLNGNQNGDEGGDENEEGILNSIF